MKFKNYFLIAGLALAVVVSSCKKDDDDDQNTNTNKAPKIEMNGQTSGNIVEIPAAAPSESSAEYQQFSSAVGNINQVGSFLTQLNNIPENATVTNRSTNAATTYYWNASDANGTYEVWYTVEEDGNNYNLTYEIAMSNAQITIPRTTYMEGWVSQDGANGHLVLNINAFTDGTVDYNYTYDWDTNASGDFHVVAHWNVDAGTYGNSDMVYEATVFASGAGQIDYTFTNYNSESVTYHYDWNADWTVINWSWTIGSDVTSGQWTA